MNQDLGTISQRTSHAKGTLLSLLRALRLGAGVAEADDILFDARVETSAFFDLYNDKVDLIPGAKGSGKSALFELFVRYLAPTLLQDRKLVLAHGVHSQGDPVFHVFTEQFATLTEMQFINFWYVYLISLVNEGLLKDPRFTSCLSKVPTEIDAFRVACQRARIPDVRSSQTLKGIIEWGLAAVSKVVPRKASLPTPAGQFTLEWPETPAVSGSTEESPLPLYVNDIQTALHRLLDKARLSIWLMLDKLDEIFPRWSDVERVALRSLLRAMQGFRGDRVRVKIFLRDDILEHLTDDPKGFPGLTHIVSRKASSLTWSEDDILHIVVKRIFASDDVSAHFKVDRQRMGISGEYRREVFYRVFPERVHSGSRQTTTLHWIYTRCEDGRGVVAPRDVINFLNYARAAEIDRMQSDSEGVASHLFSTGSILAAFKRMSQEKRDVFLKAEFPDYRDAILKFENGGAIWTRDGLRNLHGRQDDDLIHALQHIGFLRLRTSRAATAKYEVPFLYRPAFNIRQRAAE